MVRRCRPFSGAVCHAVRAWAVSTWYAAGAVFGGVGTVVRVLGSGLGWLRFPCLLLCGCSSWCRPFVELGRGCWPGCMCAAPLARGAWVWFARSPVPVASYIWCPLIFWAGRVWSPLPSPHFCRRAWRRRCGPPLHVVAVGPLLLHCTLCLCCVCVCHCGSHVGAHVGAVGNRVCRGLCAPPVPCGPLCACAVHAWGTYLFVALLLCSCGAPLRSGLGPGSCAPSWSLCCGVPRVVAGLRRGALCHCAMKKSCDI